MDRQQLLRHQINNFAQSALLLAGMVGLLALLAWIVAGPGAILWTLLGAGLVLLFAPQVSPRLILKLYGARPIAPTEMPELHAATVELARRAALPRPPRLYYLPTKAMNAFTLGRRDDAAVTLTDGLMRRLDEPEIVAILAHEIAHARHNDMWIMNLADSVSRLTRILAMVGWFMLLLNLAAIMMRYGTLPWLAIVILMISPTASALLQLALSRTREFDADLGAAELIGDPRALARALDKLERLQGNPWERVLMPGRRLPDPSLLRTHPRTEERIARLLALELPERPPPMPRYGALGAPAHWPAIQHPPRQRWTGLWH